MFLNDCCYILIRISPIFFLVAPTDNIPPSLLKTSWCRSGDDLSTIFVHLDHARVVGIINKIGACYICFSQSPKICITSQNYSRDWFTFCLCSISCSSRYIVTWTPCCSEPLVAQLCVKSLFKLTTPKTTTLERIVSTSVSPIIHNNAGIAYWAEIQGEL